MHDVSCRGAAARLQRLSPSWMDAGTAAWLAGAAPCMRHTSGLKRPHRAYRQANAVPPCYERAPCLEPMDSCVPPLWGRRCGAAQLSTVAVHPATIGCTQHAWSSPSGLLEAGAAAARERRAARRSRRRRPLWRASPPGGQHGKLSRRAAGRCGCPAGGRLAHQSMSCHQRRSPTRDLLCGALLHRPLWWNVVTCQLLVTAMKGGDCAASADNRNRWCAGGAEARLTVPGALRAPDTAVCAQPGGRSVPSLVEPLCP
jgi:hypothetical protein